MVFNVGDKVKAKVHLYRYPWKSDKGDIIYYAGDTLTVERVHNYAAGWHYWLSGSNGECGADENELERVEGE